MADNIASGLCSELKSSIALAADGAVSTALQAAVAITAGPLNVAAESPLQPNYHVIEGDTVVLAVNGEKHAFVHVKRGLCVPLPPTPRPTPSSVRTSARLRVTWNA